MCKCLKTTVCKEDLIRPGLHLKAEGCTMLDSMCDSMASTSARCVDVFGPEDVYQRFTKLDAKFPNDLTFISIMHCADIRTGTVIQC